MGLFNPCENVNSWACHCFSLSQKRFLTFLTIIDKTLFYVLTFQTFQSCLLKGLELCMYTLGCMFSFSFSIYILLTTCILLSLVSFSLRRATTLIFAYSLSNFYTQTLLGAASRILIKDYNVYRYLYQDIQGKNLKSTSIAISAILFS